VLRSRTFSIALVMATCTPGLAQAQDDCDAGEVSRIAASATLGYTESRVLGPPTFDVGEDLHTERFAWEVAATTLLVSARFVLLPWLDVSADSGAVAAIIDDGFGSHTRLRPANPVIAGHARAETGDALFRLGVGVVVPVAMDFDDGCVSREIAGIVTCSTGTEVTYMMARAMVGNWEGFRWWPNRAGVVLSVQATIEATAELELGADAHVAVMAPVREGDHHSTSARFPLGLAMEASWRPVSVLLVGLRMQLAHEPSDRWPLWPDVSIGPVAGVALGHNRIAVRAQIPLDQPAGDALWTAPHWGVLLSWEWLERSAGEEADAE